MSNWEAGAHIYANQTAVLIRAHSNPSVHAHTLLPSVPCSRFGHNAALFGQAPIGQHQMPKGSLAEATQQSAAESLATCHIQVSCSAVFSHLRWPRAVVAHSKTTSCVFCSISRTPDLTGYEVLRLLSASREPYQYGPEVDSRQAHQCYGYWRTEPGQTHAGRLPC